MALAFRKGLGSRLDWKKRHLRRWNLFGFNGPTSDEYGARSYRRGTKGSSEDLLVSGPSSGEPRNTPPPLAEADYDLRIAGNGGLQRAVQALVLHLRIRDPKMPFLHCRTDV
jgi:hypothetical protein